MIPIPLSLWQALEKRAAYKGQSAYSLMLSLIQQGLFGLEDEQALNETRARMNRIRPPTANSRKEKGKGRATA
jgi:hypothetical protein